MAVTFIRTYSGVRFELAPPSWRNVRSVDIAVALSRAPRFGGHTARPRSVLEHSLHCYEIARRLELPIEIQKACLVHDFPEAYLCDLPHPIKHIVSMSGYRDLEALVWHAISERFGWHPNIIDHPMVKAVDAGSLRVEYRELMRNDDDLLREDCGEADTDILRAETAGILTFANRTNDPRELWLAARDVGVKL